MRSRRYSTPAHEALRERILDAALPHVPFDGWTMAALERGAADLGLPRTDARRAFPEGPLDAVLFFAGRADRRMEEAVAALPPEIGRTRRVVAAIRLRLDQAAPHREAVRRALALLALPQNAGPAAQSLYRTVDSIWWAAGDRATDFSFYTKRALLAGVFASTLLYWLDDRSEGFADTHAFLDRRIADVMRIPKAAGPLKRAAAALPSPFRLMRALRQGPAGRRPPFANT